MLHDVSGQPPGGRSQLPGCALALVHHANQYLITDGYENREGLTQLLEGYAAVLRLHERYGVPANLHLSGTLVEAIAWHQPDFLELVRGLLRSGLVAIVGGTYAENILTLFPPAYNKRQLEEALWLYERHLGCPPESVRIAWVPERVWDTAALSPLLARTSLRNGGYRYVLLDDRLLFPIGGPDHRSVRAAFDATRPYGTVAADGQGPSSSEGGGGGAERRMECSRCYRIANGRGLAFVPISANLRYWIPPRSSEHWRLLREEVLSAGEDTEDRILVYADDLEKTAGVGPWERALDQYEAFLAELVNQSPRVTPVLLDAWLDRHPPGEERVIERGTFFELARGWGAGEDYRGWSESRAWAPYGKHLAAAHDAVRASEAGGGDARLLRLAWKHLLAAGHETAWHDTHDGQEGQDGHHAHDGEAGSARHDGEAAHEGRACAHWARAIASHSRACLPMSAAADWFGRGDGRPGVSLNDVDGDGDEEIVLRSEALYAVLTPRYGGRLVYLFQHSPEGGVLLVGNPTDHWNWQEELNRYMDVPANHPGALTDAGHEHDRYGVTGLGDDRAHAFVELTNEQEGSSAFGTRKSVLLLADAPGLVVCYRLPAGLPGLVTAACLSPDYYRLLREGRGGLSHRAGGARRSVRHGHVVSWLALAGREATAWEGPARADAAHGVTLRVRAGAPHFHLFLGAGEMQEGECQRLFREGRGLLHHERPAAAPHRFVRG